MPTKRQVLAALGGTLDYRRAGRALGIHPGQAYLVATGLPADGGDTHPAEELERPGALATSTQHLAYPDKPVHSSSEKPSVLEWIKRRAEQDLPMREAAGERDAAPGQPLEEVTDITHVLTQQHDQVLVLLKQLKTIPGPSDGGSVIQRSRKQSIVDMVSVALSRHEATEQEEFWPAVRSVLGDDVVEQALGYSTPRPSPVWGPGSAAAAPPPSSRTCRTPTASSSRARTWPSAIRSGSSG